MLLESLESARNENKTEFGPTKPPITQTPRLMDLPLDDIAQEVMRTASTLPRFTLSSQQFVVPDQRSLRDDSGLLVQAKGDDVQTGRVHFDTIAAELTRISMITFDIGETVDLAKNAFDGVFGTEPPELHQQGKPAPRKKLGE